MVIAVNETLADISVIFFFGTAPVVKQSIVMPVILIHNRAIFVITTGFVFSPRKLSFGIVDFAVIAYPSPRSRRIFQADEIFNRFHFLNSIFQEDPFLCTFNGNQIASSIPAMSPAFFPIRPFFSRDFMKCVTRITKDKGRACRS